MKALPRHTSEFVRAFQDYLDCFVVIGGAPTLLYIEQREGVTGVGWVVPTKALVMTCNGEIDNARPVFPGSGKPYIRTRRDRELFNNLEVKG